MKAILFIPPVLALAVVSIWIGSGRRTISTLEEESAVLRKHLESRAAVPAPKDSSTGPEAPAVASREKEPIDWKKLADEILEMRQGGSMTDMRSMIRLQQRLQAMSADDLIGALDEIAALDLSEESQRMLEQMLVGPLCEKDPELALTRFADRLDDERHAFSWQLSNAMKEWAKKDPVRATVWMDQQIAAGKFDSKSLDGKSRPRMQFEGMLIGSLLSSDPSAAAGRLNGLPEDQRAEVLRNQTGNSIKEEDQLAFANLVRAELPADEQASTLAQQASSLAWHGGYEKITEYLDRIEARPSERAAAVNRAVNSKMSQLADKRTITREDIDTMREWATSESPEATNPATGKALAQSTQSDHPMDFPAAAELAVQYNDAGGNDEVLIEFLNQADIRNNKDEARVLAGRIADPESREKILKKLK